MLLEQFIELCDSHAEGRLKRHLPAGRLHKGVKLQQCALAGAGGQELRSHHVIWVGRYSSGADSVPSLQLA